MSATEVTQLFLMQKIPIYFPHIYTYLRKVSGYASQHLLSWYPNPGTASGVEIHWGALSHAYFIVLTVREWTCNQPRAMSYPELGEYKGSMVSSPRDRLGLCWLAYPKARMPV